jgi:hypothetical protein
LNAATNVWLRPFLGFSDNFEIYMGTVFTFYCDTVPKPLVVVRSDESYRPRVITSKPLVSNKTYYWYSEAFVNQPVVKGTCQSEIYSFQTIDTSLLYNRNWWINYYIDYNEYLDSPPTGYWSLENQVWDDNEELFAEIASFELAKDSVSNIDYLGIFIDNDFPQEGLFKFSYDSIQILDRTYEFINFGKADDETLELVIKKPGMDYVLIYGSRF